MVFLRAYLQNAARPVRGFSTCLTRTAASAFRFPAMSPTMTEGGIAEWKVKEGDSFSAGDILLEIETDKATIDVETTDDGVMGKILVPNGTKEIKVGSLIGILAEDGDDLSSLSADQFSDSSSSSHAEPTPSSSEPSPSASTEPINDSPVASPSPSSFHHSASDITHSAAILPGVYRLLLGSGLEPSVIKGLKGSGKNGTLTAGDVLVAMGKLKNVWGSSEAEKLELNGRKGVFTRFGSPAVTPTGELVNPIPKPSLPQDPLALRRAVLQGLISQSQSPMLKSPKITFDDLMDDYQPWGARAKSTPLGTGEPKVHLKNEFEGLW